MAYEARRASLETSVTKGMVFWNSLHSGAGMNSSSPYRSGSATLSFSSAEGACESTSIQAWPVSVSLVSKAAVNGPPPTVPHHPAVDMAPDARAAPEMRGFFHDEAGEPRAVLRASEEETRAVGMSCGDALDQVLAAGVAVLGK